MKNNLMKNLTAASVIVFMVGGAWALDVKSNLPACDGSNVSNWNNCFGTQEIYGKWWGKYVGEFKNGNFDGYGVYRDYAGDIYVGEWKNGEKEGMGKVGTLDGYTFNAEWKKGAVLTKDGKQSFQFAEKFKDKVLTEKRYQQIKTDKSTHILILNPNGLPDCSESKQKNNCWGTESLGGIHYEGEFKRGKYHGIGSLLFELGISYFGNFKNNFPDGFGIYLYIDDQYYIGNLKEDRYYGEGIYVHKNMITTGIWDGAKLKKQLDIESISPKYAKQLHEIMSRNNNLVKFTGANLQVTNTQANAEGDFVINIQTGTDTASLKINGEEQGGRADGTYTIRKVARAGQETKFTIVAQDTNGNTDSKTITVTRQIAASSTVKYAELNPALVKSQPTRDAVAIIIGIADYKNLPSADFANDDARVFFDYAIRGLGVRAENIRLLVDADAGQGEILKTFKTWLPARVKSTTDVYVYYSGHGLPAADGQSLYLLPQLADRDLIEETAISQNKINAALLATKPKSVTIFLDSCYSGAGRTGQTLLASARPLTLKATAQTFPPDFTVISASTAEQISSSSPELKHGIFSYYLMKAMEGDADANKDGKITLGEMQSYLSENVGRQAGMMNRKQEPQLIGDSSRVLVGR